MIHYVLKPALCIHWNYIDNNLEKYSAEMENHYNMIVWLIAISSVIDFSLTCLGFIQELEIAICANNYYSVAFEINNRWNIFSIHNKASLNLEFIFPDSYVFLLCEYY